jgi:hypothetical protein
MEMKDATLDQLKTELARREVPMEMKDATLDQLKTELEELAKQAYAAYGSVTDYKNYQGLPMPQWADLTPKIRQAWRVSVLRVATLVREDTAALVLEALRARSV